MEPKDDIILGGTTSVQDEAEVEGNDALVEYANEGVTVTVLDDGEPDQEIDGDDDEDEEAIPLEKLPIQFQKVHKVKFVWKD